jgi:uncharacterized protein
MNIIEILEREFNIKNEYLKNYIELIDGGMTIPFIARYRKELTGSLDDQVLREIADRLSYLRNLEKRKEEIIKSITEQGKMTDEIASALSAAKTLVEAEDIYRPYKQKRKTRGTVARAKGLEPLAAEIRRQESAFDPLSAANEYINAELGVESAEQALAGASDIIAEDISDDAELRKTLRAYYYRNGMVISKAANPDTDSVYRMYYDFSEPVNRIAGHRVLAIDRGERENVLKISIGVYDKDGNNTDIGVSFILQKYLSKNDTMSGEIIKNAAADSLKRLIFPSIERELRTELTEKADNAAIKVFGENLRQLLMQPPIKNYVVLGLDPGFRTGCKLAVVDATGKVLETGVAYITTEETLKVRRGIETIRGMIIKHNVNLIAIGNGTASRESEAIVADLLGEMKDRDIHYIIVSEAGASVYSASKLAAAEFPDYDVSLRSAVSIARRLQDPLAELVKIEPKAIGVGQYQHDMPEARLNDALTGVVEDCVNAVGVDLNTASHSLLSYISGINAAIARNIVAFRESIGQFTDRNQVLKVTKVGPKAFEQCAGFLRIPGGKNPLDNTSVHPESYKAAEALLAECGYTAGSTVYNDLAEKTQKIGISTLAEKIGVGVPTLKDIIKELVKPGRDPRDELPKPLLRSGNVLTIKDLTPGMELEGTVRNVIDFGAFVDIGVHEDGLVHVSQLANRYVKHPLEVVKVGQIVKVKVLDVDVKRNRISLTMKG